MNISQAQPYHQPVLVGEVLSGLAVRPGGHYVDCTMGDGGHSVAILDASAPNGLLLGLDIDPEALAVSRERLAGYGQAATILHFSYAKLNLIAQNSGFLPADGILLDLGISSRQVDLESRGFSFQSQDSLDMRFDSDGDLTAADLVNHSDEKELADIIYRFGEETRSRRIAKAIVACRPIQTAGELAEIVRRSAGYPRGRTHPATRVFQALRIAVNDELGNLAQGLEQAAEVLVRGGRLVTIAYHSLEDRLIKQSITGKVDSLVGKFKPITKKVVRPSAEEVRQNRRSRSAKLRVAERT
jgi:16S rRNA (cytosine1402-N4)-methyltransferase